MPQHPQTPLQPKVILRYQAGSPHTYLDREAGREAQRDEVPQLGEVCVADGHEVNDGRHLVPQG